MSDIRPDEIKNIMSGFPGSDVSLRLEFGRLIKGIFQDDLKEYIRKEVNNSEGKLTLHPFDPKNPKIISVTAKEEHKDVLQQLYFGCEDEMTRLEKVHGGSSLSAGQDWNKKK